MMANLLTNELASGLNWAGKKQGKEQAKQKRPFKDLALCRSMFVAIPRWPLIPGAGYGGECRQPERTHYAAMQNPDGAAALAAQQQQRETTESTEREGWPEEQWGHIVWRSSSPGPPSRRARTCRWTSHASTRLSNRRYWPIM
ncbi:unnamed protein product [Boreogadus saida]